MNQDWKEKDLFAFLGFHLIFQSWSFVGYIIIIALNQRQMLRMKQEKFFVVGSGFEKSEFFCKSLADVSLSAGHQATY